MSAPRPAQDGSAAQPSLSVGEASAPPVVIAIDPSRRTNADLMVACRDLGYIGGGRTLDPTHGLGTFWRGWSPDGLVRTDIDPTKSPSASRGVDFRYMPWAPIFSAVVFDPPYKLNGTERPGADDRYGVNAPARWQDRMALILAGVRECARVVAPGGHLLVKCQDQVVSGSVVWQTDEVTRAAEGSGLSKVDRLEFLSYRPQPDGRRQVHARRNHSTLLVFRKP